MYLPIILIAVYSFNASESFAAWGGFTMDWYGKLIKDEDLLDSLIVSLKVAGLSALISAALGTVGAVSMDAMSKKAATLVTGLAYAPLVVPEVIMGVALMLFLSISPISFGIPAMILSHTTFCIPYVMIMVNIRLKAIEPAIFEAARDLGAGRLMIFRTITLPLILPGIITGALLAIAMSMDDIIISFFLTGPRDTSLPVRIYSMLKLGVSPDINALCTLMLLFTFGVVAVLQVMRVNKRT
jgi:spermidine/putrescine transport system permease protein